MKGQRSQETSCRASCRYPGMLWTLRRSTIFLQLPQVFRNPWTISLFLPVTCDLLVKHLRNSVLYLSRCQQRLLRMWRSMPRWPEVGLSSPARSSMLHSTPELCSLWGRPPISLLPVSPVCLSGATDPNSQYSGNDMLKYTSPPMIHTRVTGLCVTKPTGPRAAVRAGGLP